MTSRWNMQSKVVPLRQGNKRWPQGRLPVRLKRGRSPPALSGDVPVLQDRQT